MTNSRAKGARREREIAADIAAHLSCRACRMGRNGYSAEDIDHDLDGVHIEAKGPARFSGWKYLEQAIRDAGEKLPVVVVKADRRESVIMLRLSDVNKLMSLIGGKKGTSNEQEEND